VANTDSEVHSLAASTASKDGRLETSQKGGETLDRIRQPKEPLRKGSSKKPMTGGAEVKTKGFGWVVRRKKKGPTRDLAATSITVEFYTGDQPSS